ncbi:EVE domain-containing protein [Bacteriovorax sp. Seq25_V]|uniref:EVE domain-containing protein n=1 Tax=Bacteriovorax sp. Seq25_V TaxID=1201288 RepID=UPI000389E056|nr:EVE domain-containing protein [Bacteriovorax sp. Seq25_V]EQC46076.1 EVE domain protein [Bacteriovorax sp. Seq25_V]
MNYWIFKSEPDTFSIDDLKSRPGQKEPWNGVRNYQARNFLRDEVKVGDLILFHHSSCKVPGIAGVAKVVKAAYPDHTAQDKTSDYYDPKATQENPIWYMVDVQFVEKFTDVITLKEIKENPKFENLILTRKGNRLSIMPISKKEFEELSKLRS